MIIEPSKFPTTLVVEVDAPDDHPECGIFAGHTPNSFAEHEKGQKVQLIGREEDPDVKLFVLDRPEPSPQRNHTRRWHYAVIGWDNGVYVQVPYVHTLILQEHNNEEEHDNFWSVSISSARNLGFIIILPDYEPGALARGVVKRVS